MDVSRQLARELKLNYGVLQAQVDGMTHEECLLQPPFRGNCFNWVLGHLIQSRSRMLALAGLEPLWDGADYQRYARESDPITAAAEALPLDKLLADLAHAQDQLLARIKRMTPADFDAVPEGEERTVGEQLSFLSWHETYHAGQTELLRQLAGKDDKVI